MRRGNVIVNFLAGAAFLALCAVVCGFTSVWAIRTQLPLEVIYPPPAERVQPPVTPRTDSPPGPAPAADAPLSAAPQPPAPPSPPPEPPSQTEAPPAAASPVPGVYGWNLDLVLERSHTGRELRRYGDDYVKVLSASIAELDKALAGRDRRLNREEAQKLRAQYVKQRDGMKAHTRDFMARVVAEMVSNNDQFDGMSLIEAKNFTRLTASADVTVKVIEAVDQFHMQLPPLPKPLDLPEPPKTGPNAKTRRR